MAYTFNTYIWVQGVGQWAQHYRERPLNIYVLVNFKTRRTFDCVLSYFSFLCPEGLVSFEIIYYLSMVEGSTVAITVTNQPWLNLF
jgi:hypothetical protein